MVLLVRDFPLLPRFPVSPSFLTATGLGGCFGFVLFFSLFFTPRAEPEEGACGTVPGQTLPPEPCPERGLRWPGSPRGDQLPAFLVGVSFLNNSFFNVLL